MSPRIAAAVLALACGGGEPTPPPPAGAEAPARAAPAALTAAAGAAWEAARPGDALVLAAAALEDGDATPEAWGLLAAAAGAARLAVRADAPLPADCAAVALTATAVACQREGEWWTRAGAAPWTAGAALPPEPPLPPGDAPLDSLPAAPCAVAVSPTGAVAAGVPGHGLWWWRPGAGAVWHTAPDPCVLAFAGDALRVAGAGRLQLLRPTTPTAPLPATGLADLLRERGRLATLSVDGRWRLTSADRLRDLSAGALGPGPWLALDLRDDWTQLAALHQDGQAVVVDASSGSTRSLGGPPATALAFSPDGKQVALAGADGAVALRGGTGSDLGALDLPVQGDAVALSWGATDRELWVATATGLAHHDLRRGTAAVVPLPPDALRVAVQGRAGLAWVATADGAVARIKARSGTVEWRAPAGLGAPTAVAPLADGRHVAAADAAGRVVVLAAEDGAVVLRTPPLGAPLVDLVPASDGALLARSADGRVRVVQVGVLELPRELLFARFGADAGLTVEGDRVVSVPVTHTRPARSAPPPR